MHLVDFALIHHDAGTQQEGKHQLMLLKKAAADVGVEAVSQVAIDVDDALLQVVCRVEKWWQNTGKGKRKILRSSPAFPVS